jgi:ribosomal protein S4
MRLQNKYKIYTKKNITSFNYHSRLINFKRPKWKKLQTLIKKKYSLNKQLFLDHSCVQVNYKAWDKIKNYYKEGLKVINTYNCFYDKAINKTYLKKVLHLSKFKEKNKLFFLAFVKPIFRIDILLWKLSLLNSSYLGRQFLNSGIILVNNKCIQSNYFIKKGDIITFKLTSFCLLKSSIQSFSKNNLLFSFVEIDYYTNTIIVIKDFNSLNFSEISLIFKEFYNIKKIKDIL